MVLSNLNEMEYSLKRWELLQPEIHRFKSFQTSNADKYAQMDNLNKILLDALNEKLELLNEAIEQEERNENSLLSHSYFDLPEDDPLSEAISFFFIDVICPKLKNLKAGRDFVIKQIDTIKGVKASTTFDETE